jgi:DnaJ-class molecular chaperone
MRLLPFLFLLLASFVAADSAFDPYAALRTPRDSSKEDIRRAYREALNVLGRRAAKGGHGQVTKDEDYLLMQSVRKAYELLSNPIKKAEWDGAHPVGAGQAPPLEGWSMGEDEDDL